MSIETSNAHLPALSPLTVGLTKREYFAAQALIAYTQRGFERVSAAEYAVKAADALLKELAK